MNYRPPYLIQRIERARRSDPLPIGLAAKYQANEPRTVPEKTYINELMPLDYMGSAEFEFGTFGEAMRRVVANRADFVRFELSVVGQADKNWHKDFPLIDLTIQLYGFAHKDHVLQAKADIILFAADKFVGRTKERTQLREVFGVVNATQYDRTGKRLRKSIVSLNSSDLSAWFDLDNSWMVGTDRHQIDRIAELLGVKS